MRPMFARRFLLAVVASLSCLPLQAAAEAVEPTPTTVPLSPELVTAPTDGLTLTPPSAQEIRDDLPPMPTIDLTTSPDDLWARVRNGFGMPDLDSPLVANRQAWYLNRPEMLQRIFDRSRRYLHHIVGELERRGMPTELALLPMVESAFNPLAYSRARALGMWQFIPSTGKNYKLDQNWWLDERRDIIASTSAALDYLQTIYEMHGDWQLALASYNWGEHAVARAIAKNQAKGLPTDYASLSMPGETRYYVPKLQALKNIVAHPELFGIALEPIPNRPYFGTVDIPGDMDLALAAKLAEVPIEEFVALNPAFQRPLIRGGDRAGQLVLPSEKLQTFRANLERYAASDLPLANWRTHSLKAGEQLDAVAKRYGLTVAHLKQLNGITPRVKLHTGFNLLVPGPGAQLPDRLAAQLPKMPSEPRKGSKGKKRKSHAKGVGKHKPSGTVRRPVNGKRH
jgi:membrane-bound lytic murein transglycosylase D